MLYCNFLHPTFDAFSIGVILEVGVRKSEEKESVVPTKQKQKQGHEHCTLCVFYVPAGFCRTTWTTFMGKVVREWALNVSVRRPCPIPFIQSNKGDFGCFRWFPKGHLLGLGLRQHPSLLGIWLLVLVGLDSAEVGSVLTLRIGLGLGLFSVWPLLGRTVRFWVIFFWTKTNGPTVQSQNMSGGWVIRKCAETVSTRPDCTRCSSKYL
jgi:hypothetical protein